MAVRFDVSTDRYVTTLSRPTASSYSATFWVCLEVDRNQYSNMLLFRGSGGGNWLSVNTLADGVTIAAGDNGTDIASTTAMTAGTGAWFKVGVTVNGTAVRLFTAAAANTPTITTGTLTVGSAVVPTEITVGSEFPTTSNFFFNGRMAALKIWNATLTDNEILAELNQYVPRRTQSLLHFHPFINAELTDYSGNAADLSAGTTATTTVDGPPLRWSIPRQPKAVSDSLVPIDVSAGGDASIDQYDPLVRTATEDGNLGSITARSWTVISGPNQVGQTLSTNASLNWAPTVGGVYVLRYSATNAAGVGTDDITVSVFSLNFPVTADITLGGSATGIKKVSSPVTANVELHGTFTGGKKALSSRTAALKLTGSMTGQRINKVTAALKLQAAALNVGRPGKANVTANIRLFGNRTNTFRTNVNRAVSATIKLQASRTGIPHKAGSVTAGPLHLTATRTNTRKRVSRTVAANIKLAASIANRFHTSGSAVLAAIDLNGSTSNNSRSNVGGPVEAIIMLYATPVTSSTRVNAPVLADITLHAQAFTQRIITEVAEVILPRADNTTQYDLVCVARIPQSNGPPLLVEVDPIDWTSITLTEELNAPNTLSINAKLSTMTDPIVQRTNNIDDLPTELWLFRNSKHVFAGPLLGGNVTGESIQLSANGLQSYLAGMFVVSDLVFNNVDQAQIVRKLIDQWQVLDYGNFGIDTTNVADTGIKRSLTYKHVEGHQVGQRIVDLSKLENGFDFEIEPGGRKLELAYPKSGVDRSAGEDAVVFDAVNVTSTSVTFSAVPGDLASEGFGAATGTGNDQVLTSTKSNLELRARYGRLGVFGTFDQVNDQATLDSYTQALVNARNNTLWIPGPDARVTVDSDISKYDIGDTVSYQLNSRLSVPTSFRIRKRTITATPQGMETVTLEFV